jgi:cytochrome c2
MTRDSLWIYGLGAGVLAVTAYVYADFYLPEYRDYQAGFRELVGKRFGVERARQIPSGVQQIWIAELGRVDRCVTCHQGLEWKGLESAPHPYRSHPREILARHPPSRYGCTLCHGGQGYAVDQAAAHATTIDHWEEPLLGAELGKTYLISDRKALLQIQCNICHRYDRATSGADYINDAKKLVQEKGCRACHKINGRGGAIGPDLNEVGGKSAEQYDYARLSGAPSIFAWHVAHFKNPKTMVGESIMPNFNFGSRDAQALAMLVMSWKRAGLPPSYLPGLALADRPTPEEIEKERQMMTGEGAFFVRKMCFVCHEVTTLGIESAAKIGPDLSDAFADVQSRFGKTLEDFLARPTGTMAVVLSTQIQLRDDERNEAIEKLKIAYQRRLAKEKK